MTKAILGSGTLVEYNNGSSWVEAIEPRSIGEIGDEGTFVDATHLNSPNQTREYIAGLSDTLEKDLEFNFVADDANQIALRSRAKNKTQTDFRVTFPAAVDSGDQQRLTFTMALTSWKMSDPTPDGIITFVVNGRITGTVSESIV